MVHYASAVLTIALAGALVDTGYAYLPGACSRPDWEPSDDSVSQAEEGYEGCAHTFRSLLLGSSRLSKETSCLHGNRLFVSGHSLLVIASFSCNFSEMRSM